MQVPNWYYLSCLEHKNSALVFKVVACIWGYILTLGFYKKTCYKKYYIRAGSKTQIQAFFNTDAAAGILLKKAICQK